MSSVSDVTDAVATASLADASGGPPPPSSAIADGGEQVVTPWDVAGGAPGATSEQLRQEILGWLPFFFPE